MKKTNNYSFLFLLLLLLAACEGDGGNGFSFEKKPGRGHFDGGVDIQPLAANYNPLPSSVEIIFPSDVVMTSVSEQDIVVTSSGTCPANPYLSFSTSAQVMTVLLDVTGCSHQNTIKIAINMSKVLNSAGKTGKGIHEVVYTLNTDTASSPSLNLTSGSYNWLPGYFTVLFDASIDMSTVTADMFTLTGTGGCAPSPMTNLVVTGQEARVNYDAAGCTDGDRISISVNNSFVVDQDGRRGTGVMSRVLTMDMVGVNSNSVNFDVNAGDKNPLPTSVTLTFPADINMDSLVLSDFVVTGDGSCPGTVLTALIKVANTAQLTFNTAGCANGNSIDFLLPMNSVLDRAGNPGVGDLTSSWRLVSSAPAIPTLGLTSGAVAALPTNLVLTFDDTINMSSINSNSLTVTSTGMCPVSPLTGVTKLGHQATLTLDTTGCLHGDSMSLSLNMGLVSNTVGTLGSGILAETFTLDNQGPGVPVISVDSGAFAVLPTQVVAIFAADTDMTTINPSTVEVSGSGSCSPNSLGIISQSNSNATINLVTAGCSDGDSVELTIHLDQIKDVLGNPGASVVTRTFTMDSTVPSAPFINFASGAVSALPTNLEFQFDGSSIDMNSVDALDFTVLGSGQCLTNPVTGFVVNADLVTLTLNTTSCANNDSLIVTLNMGGITNSSGVAGSGSFRNIVILDNQGPAQPTSPNSGAVVASFPASVAFDFPADTDMNSVSAADFAAIGTGSCNASSVTGINKNNFRVTVFVDSSMCSSSDQLTIKALMIGITDALGNAGAGESVLVYTLDTTGPVLPVITPASVTVVSLPVSISVNFSSDTLMSSVGVSDISLLGTNACTGSVLNLVPSTHSAIATISTSGCVSGDVLTFIFAGAGITDALGNVGSGTAQASYTLDNQGINASALNLSPSGATLVVYPTTISVTFPADTDMTSVTAEDFSSMTNGTCPANAVGSVTKSGLTATLSLYTFGCLSGNSISIILSGAGIKDTLGNSGAGAAMVTYILDNIGPQSGVFNLASSTLAALPASLTITFSNDTDMNSVSAADISLSGTGSCLGSSISSLSKSGQVATLNLNTSSCNSSESLFVSLIMSGVTDALGNGGSGTVNLTFNLDNVGPQSATVNTASATLAAMPASVVYTFSNDTDMSSVTAADFVASGTGSCPVNPISNFSKNAQTATLTLSSSGCVTGNVINLDLNMVGVTDAVGNAGSGTISRIFTLDATGPAAASNSTASGLMNALPTSVNFTFSSDTEMSSVSASDFIATGNGSCPVNALSGISISGQVATVNLNTSGCGNGNKIDLSLNMALVTDAVGNVGSGTVAATYTLDNQGPALAVASIATGVFTTLPASVTFTFGADTNMSTVSAADFTATGSGTCLVNALGSVSISGLVATVSLNRTGCANASRIDLSIDMNGISDNVGNNGTATGSFSYTLDNQGPASASGNILTSTLAALPASVNFTFSSDTDMNSVALNDFSAIGSGACPSNALASISKNGQVATINLNRAGCANGNKIDLTLNMAGVADALGNAGSGSVSYSYTLDNQGPAAAVASVTTSTRSTLPTSVNFTFSSDTEMNSVTLADFTAVGNGSCVSNALNGISISGQVATIGLNTSGCGSGNKIDLTLSMTGVTDALGNAGVGVVANTYTLDNQGPASAVGNILSNILQSLPASVNFTFSADTDMNSVTSADFAVVGSGSCPINALVSISKIGQVATVNLDRTGCLSGNKIDVTLNMTGVTDAHANAGTGTVSHTYTLDNEGPAKPTVNQTGGSLVSLPTSLVYTFASDTDMSTVSMADFSIVYTGLCTPSTITSVTVVGQTATVAIQNSGCILYSTITIKVDMTGIKDKTGTGNPGTGTSTIFFDKII